MKFDKGLSSDTRIQAQPAGTVPFSKNGIRINEIDQNEPGFLPSSAVIPYTPIGVIETDKYPVIFSTNNINSALGYYNADTDAYIPIANDANFSYKLGFSTDFPINGQAQRNYKGEIIVAFTDFNTFPKFMNCDVPVVNSLDDWRLFPLADIPTLNTTIIDGGILPPGAYYILGKLIKNDGTETQFLVTSDVLIISGSTDNSGKGIQIEFTNLDSDYNQIQVGIISKIKGVTAGALMEPIAIGTGGRASVVYTGANLTSAATLEELLVQPIIYSKAKTIGQLNDALYLGNLEKDPEPNMQPYALTVRIEWVSQLITISPSDPDHASGKKRSLAHFEVYAFYIRYSKKGGAGWTQLYTIPGQAPNSNDLAASAEAQYGELSAQVYMVQDTIRSWDNTAKIGTPGTWINLNERYPDTIDYDASVFGGSNLRNQLVQHHRMPSLRWCKQNLYESNSNYGKDSLDLLGIRAVNVNIPAQYQDQLDGGYEIYYAKRTINNSTVIAQSAWMYAARHGTGAGTYTITGPDTGYKTTGGNWNAQVDWEGNSREKPLVLDLNLFRFHAFDLLYNQPAINPKFLRQELFFHRPNLPMVEDFTLTGGSRDAPITYLVDYVKDGAPPIASSDGSVIRKISDAPGDKAQYVPNNLVSGKWHNVMAEKVFAGKTLGIGALNLGQDISYSSLWTGQSSQKPSASAQWEYCYLSNLMNLPDNMYLPFNGQSVVRMAPRQTGNSPMFGGDMFLCDYTFNTYGWHDYQNSTYSKDAARDPFMGIKAARRIACECASNLYTRFEIPGNIYSKWYPVSPLEKDDNNMYLNLFDRRIDPNQFGYNKDSNALNDIVTAEMFNPLNEQLTKFPFRIHRSGKLNKQLKKRSWRTFLPLDYYEMQKNMGVIEHLEGMDDRLFIHCLNALFFTQPKLNLEQGTLSVVIGNGDIFDFEPQETYSDKLGLAGSQHNLACYRTPAGYLFIDANQGKFYLFKGQLKLMTQGLSEFFKDHTRITENNPFVGNGFTIGYDPEHERILFTCKNLVKPSGIKELQKTQAFIDTLTPGESLVTDNNRLMRFLGVSTEYQCEQPIPVSISDIILSIPENTPVDTTIHTITPISGIGLSYFILSGNIDNAFTLTTDGKLKVSNQSAIDYEVRHQIILQAKAISTNGLSDLFLITVNITDVVEPPTSGPQQFTIPETSPSGSVVGTVPADGHGSPVTFAIVGGNDAGAFTINATTGQITVANSSQLDFETGPVYLLSVSVSNGIDAVAVPVTINLTNVNEPPPLNDATITINESTPTATVVYQFQTEDPEGLSGLVFEIVNASTPGVFAIVQATGEIVLTNNSHLNAATTPQYTITVRVTDLDQQSDEGILTINVLPDAEFIEFRPSGASCSGGCPAGYDPTDDGLYCEKLTVIPATPPTGGGGVPVTVKGSVNDSYSNFGALIYQPGYNDHGAGTIQQWLQAPYVWRNLDNTIIDGPLNRCGVEGVTSVPDNEPVGFSIPIVLTETTDVFIAIAGDNKCKIAIDGVIVVDQDPDMIASAIEAQLPVFAGQGIALAFKFWHIYPFTLQAGTRFIGIEGVNYGGPFGFGAEIYKNTATELAAATLKTAYTDDPDIFPLPDNYYNNLDLLFTTRSTRTGTFDSGITSGYSCPVNYAMDGSTIPPTCVLVERVASTTRIWSSIQIYSLRTNSVVATIPNVAGQTYQGIEVPFFPPVNDHIDCGGTKTLYYNAPKATSAAKNDCTSGVGSIVKYAVPGGKYTSFDPVEPDVLAQNEANTNAQAYANAHGTCINQNG
jgi:hypothetical protein